MAKFFVMFECDRRKHWNGRKTVGCNQTSTVEVPEDAFSFSSDPCDLCGSHDHLSVTVRCPICGERKEIVMREH
jgi:hypothetical protein